MSKDKCQWNSYEVRNNQKNKRFRFERCCTSFLIAIAILFGCYAFTEIAMAGDQPTLTSFTTPITYTIGGFHSKPVAMADFNRDGKADLAATITYSGYEGIWIMLGNGDGSFQPAIRHKARNDSSYFSDSVTVGDFNLDGIPDIAAGTLDFYGVNGRVSILLGNGDGSFRLLTNNGLSYGDNFGSSYDRIVIGDLNKDGKPDLAIENSNNGGNGSYTISIHLGNGDGSFKPAIVYKGTWLNGAHSLVVADFNGDYIPDLTIICYEYTLILPGKGDGTFPYYYTVHTDYGALVTVGDFNNDNKIDLATVFGHVSILLGNGDFTFQPAINHYDTPNGITSVTVGNFNGDRNIDLAITNYGGWDGVLSRWDQGVSILLSKGDGSFQPRQFYYTPSNEALSVVAGDIDSNGKPDLVVAHSIGAISILLNTTPQPPIDGGITPSPTECRGIDVVMPTDVCTGICPSVVLPYARLSAASYGDPTLPDGWRVLYNT
ncbi:MAG: VCBS repeat-containing protein, partial [Methylococcaceae bacterium]